MPTPPPRQPALVLDSLNDGNWKSIDALGFCRAFQLETEQLPKCTVMQLVSLESLMMEDNDGCLGVEGRVVAPHRPPGGGRGGLNDCYKEANNRVISTRDMVLVDRTGRSVWGPTDGGWPGQTVSTNTFRGSMCFSIRKWDRIVVRRFSVMNWLCSPPQHGDPAADPAPSLKDGSVD